MLWDSAYVSREYLGVCNDEGVVVAPPNASRKPSYTFEVASWDRTTKHEGEGRRRARSAGIILKDKHGCIAISRKRSGSVGRASEPTAEGEADTQEKKRKYIQCATCLKELVAGTLECFYCRSLLTYALDCKAADLGKNHEETKEESFEGSNDEEETRKEKRAREEPKPATMKASPQRYGGTHGAAPSRETETPAAMGALEAFNRRFRVHAQMKCPTHERNGALSQIYKDILSRRSWARKWDWDEPWRLAVAAKGCTRDYRVKGAVPSWILEHPHQDPPEPLVGGPCAGHKRPLGEGPVVRGIAGGLLAPSSGWEVSAGQERPLPRLS